MAKNFLNSNSLLPFLSSASIAFSREYERMAKAGFSSKKEETAYANVDECLREGIQKVHEDASLYSGYLSFAKGALRKARTEEGAVLGYMAYECALSFKDKTIVTGKDWAEGFRRGVEAIKAFYDSPIIQDDEKIVDLILQEKPTNVEEVAAFFRRMNVPNKDGQVLRTFLACQAEGFLSPEPKAVHSVEEFSPYQLGKSGYRLSFSLQILNKKIETDPFDYEEYVAILEAASEELECERRGMRIIVNLSTFDPSIILSVSQKYGEFIAFQMDNVYLYERDSHPRICLNKKDKEKSKAAVVEASSQPMVELFLKLGASVAIDCSSCPQITIGDYLDAFDRSSAQDIIFLPNSKTSYLLGKIASKLAKEKNVIVLPSSSVQECYFALSNALFEEENIDDLLASLLSGIESISSLYAERGELLEVLKGYEGIDEAEFCFILSGEKADKDEIEAVKEALEEDYPFLEIGEIECGQKSPVYLLGVSK